jgi:hypothetical protein
VKNTYKYCPVNVNGIQNLEEVVVGGRINTRSGNKETGLLL